MVLSVSQVWILSTLIDRADFPPTVERLPCSSQSLRGALKSYKWPPQPGFCLSFIDIKLLRKCLTTSGEDWKWQTSEEAATRAWKWETMFPQERDSAPSPPAPRHACYFWGRRMFAISGPWSLQVPILPGWRSKKIINKAKKSLQLGLIAANVFLMWSRSCAPLLSPSPSPLFHIHPSLIKSSPQARGGSIFHAPPHPPIPPVPLLDCQNKVVSSSPIRPHFLARVSFLRLHSASGHERAGRLTN